MMKSVSAPPALWIGVALIAAIGGIFVPLAAEKVPLESLGIAVWLRSGVLFSLAVAAPLVASAAIMRAASIPDFASVLTRNTVKFDCRLTPAIGLLFVALTLLAILVALGLVFDPRYKDFPYAPLTAAIIPFFVLSFFVQRPGGPRSPAETVAAGTLVLSLIYVTFNEGFENWQSLWLCALFAALAFTLSKARAVRG